MRCSSSDVTLSPSMLQIILVGIAAFVAAAVNAVAGGGTFITFPSLTGVMRFSDKAANMTSTIGLWPGSASSLVPAMDDFRTLPPGMLVLYSIISLVGATLGAVLLRITSEVSFRLVLPWLLLLA